jgi:hypothetical protein
LKKAGAAAPLDEIFAFGGTGSANLPDAGGDTEDAADWSLLDRISGGIDFMDLFAGGNNVNSLQYYVPQEERLVGETRRVSS